MPYSVLVVRVNIYCTFHTSGLSSQYYNFDLPNECFCDLFSLMTNVLSTKCNDMMNHIIQCNPYSSQSILLCISVKWWNADIEKNTAENESSPSSDAYQRASDQVSEWLEACKLFTKLTKQLVNNMPRTVMSHLYLCPYLYNSRAEVHILLCTVSALHYIFLVLLLVSDDVSLCLNKYFRVHASLVFFHSMPTLVATFIILLGDT